MNNLKYQQLLKRIEKLETLTERLKQAIFEIRDSCSCVSEFEEPDQECPGSICEVCGQLDCICLELPEIEEPKIEEEEPTEPEDTTDHD